MGICYNMYLQQQNINWRQYQARRNAINLDSYSMSTTTNGVNWGESMRLAELNGVFAYNMVLPKPEFLIAQ